MKKAIIIALLVALAPTMAQADTDTQQLARMKQLEQAIRLQNVTILAVRQGNYSLACKAQKVASEATVKAHIVDVDTQSQTHYVELCTMDRALAPSDKSWLRPANTTDFEPAGVYFVERH